MAMPKPGQEKLLPRRKIMHLQITIEENTSASAQEVQTTRGDGIKIVRKRRRVLERSMESTSTPSVTNAKEAKANKSRQSKEGNGVLENAAIGLTCLGKGTVLFQKKKAQNKERNMLLLGWRKDIKQKDKKEESNTGNEKKCGWTKEGKTGGKAFQKASQPSMKRAKKRHKRRSKEEKNEQVYDD
eukprot:10456964-Ditylum_brightwellii.AAC.1